MSEASLTDAQLFELGMLTPKADYDELPEPIKQMFTETEYLWLNDATKAGLQQRLTEPDWEE